MPGSTQKASDVYVFDKLDGSNLRFEWTKKQGWFKYGTRTRLLDESDPVFGKAIPIFLSGLATELDKVIAKQRWQHVVAFAEFLGPNSFAGQHDPSDTHVVSLIDISPNKKGVLDPRDYLDDVYPEVTHRAAFLGRMNWGEALVQMVEDGKFEGASFEGVVGKYMDKKRLIMLKAKSRAWKEKVKALYGDQASLILES